MRIFANICEEEETTKGQGARSQEPEARMGITPVPILASGSWLLAPWLFVVSSLLVPQRSS